MMRTTSSGSCVRLSMALEAIVVVAIEIQYRFFKVALGDTDSGLGIDLDYAHLEVNRNPKLCYAVVWS